MQPLSTNYALRRAGAPLDLWGEIDPSLLESGREDIPDFRFTYCRPHGLSGFRTPQRVPAPRSTTLPRACLPVLRR